MLDFSVIVQNNLYQFIKRKNPSLNNEHFVALSAFSKTHQIWAKPEL